MKAVTRYLLEIDNSYDAIYKKKFGTLKYFLPEDLHDNDPTKTVLVQGMLPQIGRLVSVPKKGTLGLQEGDIVIFYHFVTNNLIEGNLYWSMEDTLLARYKDGEFEMFNERIMVDKIEQEDEEKGGILIKKLETNKVNEAIVRATPKISAFKTGDRIALFHENHFYSFMFGDKEMFMVKGDTSVPFKFKKKGIELMEGWVLIEPLDKEYNSVSQAGLITKGIPRRGRVAQIFEGARDIKEGDEVIYQKRSFFKYRLNDKDYYLVNTTIYDGIELVIRNGELRPIAAKTKN